ncbi:MAG: hypothetical protein JXR97_13200 [Planctomycetes bacterium]|nr:hypothetical protein [Planctomycetota bacterium]
MIEINLLPESMRKAEATPLPRFIAICVGIILIGALVVWNLYLLKETDNKNKTLAQLQKTLKEKKAKAAELDEIEGKLASIRDHVDVIKGLYKKRRIWSKLLYDLKQITTHDPSVDDANPMARYIWLNEIVLNSGKKGESDVLEVNGYASNNEDPTASLEDVQILLREMTDHKSKEGPEVKERKRLQKEYDDMKKLIEDKQKAWDRLRAENPGIEAKSPEVEEMGKKLEELDVRLKELERQTSGKIAITPFRDFFEPAEIRLEDTSWGTAPTAGNDLKEGANLPKSCRKFKIIAAFKKDEPEPVAAKGRR